MANITRIKAGDPGKKKPQPASSGKQPPVRTQHTNKQSAKSEQKAAKAKQRAERKADRKPMPLPLRIITWPFRMIAKPFIALGRYIRDSWREIRQVRWPSRGATWKMVLAVFVYAGIFMVFIMLLDALFTFIFNNLLG